jgi:hypothetical protein
MRRVALGTFAGNLCAHHIVRYSLVFFQEQIMSLRDQYQQWCIDNPDQYRKTCGHYGPEFQMRVDAPIDDLAEMIRHAGFEPTMVRLDILLGEMQETFLDKHGGSPAGVVAERILEQAADSIEELVENGQFDEEDE